ncbi:glutathionylspermidine synthase family protein [Salipiger mucosus]|uniref:glutathionylspermidine synthase family protein n=1 Tax=Salipiger mucosus TaxID=263378 RepID=UPI00037C819A|nr:glutathionylspermidine synthase family protein [Salipiger mucosus]
MRLKEFTPREGWQSKVEDTGLPFHTVDGEVYWSEGRVYELSPGEVDRIRHASDELHAMCLDLVSDVVETEALMRRFGIPEVHWNMIAESWRTERDRGIAGRFDLALGGGGVPKMLEYNAETPGMGVESSVTQSDWLAEQIDLGVLPGDAGQFNTLQEALRDRLAAIYPAGSDVHFTCASFEEDYAYTELLGRLLFENGSTPHFTLMDEIRIDQDGHFTDGNQRIIRDLVKFYAWDFMFFEAFCEAIPASGCRMVEPAWKSILSSKALLPLLWERHRGHPNILKSAFLDEDVDFDGLHFFKPLFSGNGEGIEARKNGRVLAREEQGVILEGAAAGILQDATDVPVFEGSRTPPGALSPARSAVIGSWMVEDACVGMMVAENDGLIGGEERSFSPHFILDR